MSVQISCTICGASSPRTMDPVPAAEWSRSHRCSTQRLIELAAERRTISRLGKLTARETDRDLVIMGEMAKRLAECAGPQAQPSDARVEAAARRLFGATVDSMGRARELARVALTAAPLVACPHWAPGKITFRNGCTACAAIDEQGESR